MVAAYKDEREEEEQEYVRERRKEAEGIKETYHLHGGGYFQRSRRRLRRSRRSQINKHSVVGCTRSGI